MEIFENCPEHIIKFSEELLAKSMQIQDEILKLMTEPVSRPTDTFKHQVSKRCQALASFMETLMDEVARPDLKLDLPQETELTSSERDSVMLGEISPHHDYYDSKSSSETPPSYNQLNYNENLQRFFNSKPTTLGTDEAMKIESTIENETSAQSTELSPVQRFEGGCGDSGSAGNSSASNIQLESATNTSNTGTGTSSDSFNPPTLTEALLIRHNDDMEKCMIKKHREARICGRGAEKNKKEKNNQDHTVCTHGVKRSGSRSWEADANKNSKQQHLSENHRLSKVPSTFLTSMDTSETPREEPKPMTSKHSAPEPRLWPPFSFGLTSVPNNQKTAATNPYSPQPTGIFPAVYIMPTQIGKQPQEHPGPPGVQPYYMAGLLYPHPVVYPQTQVMYQPLPLQTVSPSLGLPDRLLQNTTTTTTNSFAVSNHFALHKFFTQF